MGQIRVGRPDAKPDMSAHIDGTRQGNEGPAESQPGHHRSGTSDARRSTGVHWKKHDAILPAMPNISPG
ncbi:hypothetical protein [Streptomyces oceani]|uniref:Uncharacterized protein n=1 Tax=Streptomyces oceani TaxID=1075402 RepID=A0A1E7KH95_9ACTN|nr:hypothetical protein [Streptomyces oceani]OEV03214.1 hypothetical protein AN216_12805 [Streptomyces oceani]